MGRSSGFRIILLAAPSHPSASSGQWLQVAAFVPGHSGGSATDLHRLPLAHGRSRIEHTELGVKKTVPGKAAKALTQGYTEETGILGQQQLLKRRRLFEHDVHNFHKENTFGLKLTSLCHFVYFVLD
jgi:hypothetical protein